MIDPLLMELVRRIPKPGSEWPANERLRWFRVMGAALDLVYMDDEARLGDSPLIEVALEARELPSQSAAALVQPSWLDCLEHIPGSHFLNIFPASSDRPAT